jgi:hypothetical protein
MTTTIWTTSGDVQKVLEALRIQHGDFRLAMLYNEDGVSSSGWNLIIASQWADALGKAAATGVVVNALSEGLGFENKHAISRVTVLPTTDPFVREVTSTYQIASPGASQWITNASVAGVPMGAYFVFYSRPD